MDYKIIWIYTLAFTLGWAAALPVILFGVNLLTFVFPVIVFVTGFAFVGVLLSKEK